MRATLFMLAGLALFASTAAAGVRPPPRIPLGASIETVRARLTRAGFEPARFEMIDNFCGRGEAAPCRDDGRAFCAVDIEYCQWLFVRRADDALFLVEIGNEKTRRGRTIGLQRLHRLQRHDPDFAAGYALVRLPSGRTAVLDDQPANSRRR